jgi:hypothetical protein
MFTHLNFRQLHYTTGEIVSGATSGATGVVQSITATKSAAATSISVASPGVVTLTAHGFNDGQQITIRWKFSNRLILHILKAHIQLEMQLQILLNYMVQMEQQLKM